MSAWAPVLAAYWFWFLADCVKLARFPRFLLSGPWFGRGPSVGVDRLNFSFPEPCAWQIALDDPPLSLSPEGIANIAGGSAGRPVPEPDHATAWCWEKINTITEKHGWIVINHQRFCRVTALVNAARLRSLQARCVPLGSAERSSLLAREIARWFRPLRAQRQLRVVAGRTRTLAAVNLTSFLFALAITVYLAGGFADRLEPLQAARLAGWLPLFAVVLLALHIGSIVSGWRTHRALLPTQREARVALLLSAALLPPQALRLRAQIGSAYLAPAHPITWIAAVGNQDQFARYARQLLRDLHWPLPIYDEFGSQAESIAAWMRGRVLLEVARLHQLRKLSAESLLVPPRRDSAGSCSYCPRCGDQFQDGPTHCQRGIKLLSLK